jgi:hypothetical protein
MHEAIRPRTHRQHRDEQDHPDPQGDERHGAPEVSGRYVRVVHCYEQKGDPKREDKEPPAKHVAQRVSPVPWPRLTDHGRAVLANDVPVVYASLYRQNLGCTIRQASHEHTPALVTEPLNSFPLLWRSWCPVGGH